MKREDVINEASKWLGTRWRHQGRTARGIDCAGLLLNVGNALKLMNYHCSDYPRNTHRDHFVNHFKIFGIQKPVLERKIGDMLLFRDGVYACHCGILDLDAHGNEFVIHAYHLSETTVREPLLGELLKKITHCFNYKELED